MPSITLSLPVAATTVTAGLHSSNYAALQTLLNGGLDESNLDTTGTPSASTYLRGDMAWSSLGLTNPPYFLNAHSLGVTSALAANSAKYMPITVLSSFVVTSMRFWVGTQSGNYDIGIYDSSFAKVWSKGSTACPASGSATVLISAGSPTSLTLSPGVYWLAFAFDNGVATTTILNTGAPLISGVAYSKAASFPLPASLAAGTTPPVSDHAVILGVF